MSTDGAFASTHWANQKDITFFSHICLYHNFIMLGACTVALPAYPLTRAYLMSNKHYSFNLAKISRPRLSQFLTSPCKYC
ncbi:hypothetical protein ALTERO38_20416 [Alteromonas sp. 38]|nr:hypothetical protein ALTER154_100119 [Alteromonas sp. 154]VXB09234.1 hypothetical protein ALTERO38_20416 [Alteromonas sp. 38]